MDEQHTEDALVRPPVIQLMDLFVWTAICGVMVALCKAYYDVTPIKVAWAEVWLVLLGGGSATVLTGTLLLIRHTLRFGRFSLQPGHWLMCVWSFWALGYIATMVNFLIFWSKLPPGSDPGEMVNHLEYRSEGYFFAEMWIDGVVLLLMIAAACYLRVRLIWYLVLIPEFFQAMKSLSRKVANVTELESLNLSDWIAFNGFASMVFALIMGLAIYDGLSAKEKRDQLHWIGVVSVAAIIFPRAFHALLRLL